MRTEDQTWRRRQPGEAAFTLLELVVVLVILGLLAAAGGRAVGRALEQARFEETERRLLALRAALVGEPDLRGPEGRTDFGYAGDLGDLPASLDRLVARGDDPPWAMRPEPTSGIARPAGWHGPYLRPTFREDPAAAFRDGWGQAIRLVRDGPSARLASDGPDGRPGTPDDLSLDLTSEVRGTLAGLLLDEGGRPRPGPVVLVAVRAGLPVRLEARAGADGRFAFPGVPVGRHPVLAAAAPGLGDPAVREVVVHPGRVAHVTLQQPGEADPPRATP
jgi:prepilin-type N-terminal cleavage/methylation domain-containing protein